MNVHATSPARSVPQQYADQTFPYVLVASTGGTVAVLASILATALALA